MFALGNCTLALCNFLNFLGFQSLEICLSLIGDFNLDIFKCAGTVETLWKGLFHTVCVQDNYDVLRRITHKILHLLRNYLWY